MGSTVAAVKCGASTYIGTAVPLLPGRYDSITVNNGKVNYPSCDQAPENWRGTLDVVANGNDWVFYLSVEVDGLRYDYKFEARTVGALTDRTLIGTPICGSEVPLYDEHDGGAGSREAGLSVIQPDGTSRKLLITLRHPTNGGFRRVVFSLQ